MSVLRLVIDVCLVVVGWWLLTRADRKGGWWRSGVWIGCTVCAALVWDWWPIRALSVALFAWRCVETGRDMERERVKAILDREAKRWN